MVKKVMAEDLRLRIHEMKRSGMTHYYCQSSSILRNPVVSIYLVSGHQVCSKAADNKAVGVHRISEIGKNCTVPVLVINLNKIIPNCNTKIDFLLHSEVVCLVERMTEDDDEIFVTKIHRRLKKENQLIVSTSSIRKIHQRLGWKHGRTRFCPLISEVNRETRLMQASQWIETGETFDNVIFMDEMSVELARHTKYSRRNEQSSIKPQLKHPHKIPVWGAISKKGPGPIILFTGIMKKDFFQEDIIRKVVAPFIVWDFKDGHQFFFRIMTQNTMHLRHSLRARGLTGSGHLQSLQK
nr:PREDICTED: uncharacterized protein LOC102345902 isoform X2 [Latimeria chalumnae]|eukprot:XP_006011230.1 PREDICTED: uncharacterized protein LOC102345902 isoform X2 [Latimeria chalumnae]